MAFQLKPHETPDKGVKRIVRKQLDGALAALDRENTETVHDVRVHFKRVRACLRLERAMLGGKTYRRENRFFRDAARPLRQVRDAEIMIETLDKLGGRETIDLKSVLQQRCSVLYRRVLDKGHMFDSIAQLVKDARERLKNWPQKGKNWQVLEPGLKRGYRRNRNVFVQAREHPTDENLHEWRKQAKYLWYQLLVLERVWPQKVKKWDKQFHQLTKILGDDHDLAFLRTTLTKEKEPHLNTESMSALLTAVDLRRMELQQQAFTIGKRLYSWKPKRFTNAFRDHWKEWKR